MCFRANMHITKEKHISKEENKMLNRENTYFKELEEAGEEYEAKKDALDEKKKELVEKYGYGSEKLEAWYKEKNELTFPFKEGECKAYRAWKESSWHEDEELVMDDFLWEKEIKDFLETLKKAGITTFIYANKSTSAMENMRDFLKNGCTMDGAKTITRKEHRWGQDEDEEIFGIHFTIC